jgi:hypothetical protein
MNMEHLVLVLKGITFKTGSQRVNILCWNLAEHPNPDFLGCGKTTNDWSDWNKILIVSIGCHVFYVYKN